MSEVDVVFTIFFVELSPIPSIRARVIKLIVSQSSCLDEENLDKTAPNENDIELLLRFNWIASQECGSVQTRLRSGLA